MKQTQVKSVSLTEALRTSSLVTATDGTIRATVVRWQPRHDHYCAGFRYGVTVKDRQTGESSGVNVKTFLEVGQILGSRFKGWRPLVDVVNGEAKHVRPVTVTGASRMSWLDWVLSWLHPVRPQATN